MARDILVGVLDLGETTVVLRDVIGAVVAGGLDEREERLVLGAKHLVCLLEEMEVGDSPDVDALRVLAAFLVYPESGYVRGQEAPDIGPVEAPAEKIELLITLECVDDRVLIDDQGVSRGGVLGLNVRVSGNT